MIETAWDEYRAWAACASALQRSSQNWNTAALASAAAAAVFGAGAIQAANHPQLAQFGPALSLAAAAAAGAVPILGKEILATGTESKWIRARATGEAIKSECYRYAARVGPYAGADADDLFERRRAALAQAAVAHGLVDKHDPVGTKTDPRRPPYGFDAAWYRTNRINDQIFFYERGQARHERAAGWLRWLAFGASAAAALFGVIGATYQPAFAPWIGALTTIATAIAAQGLMSRRQQLAASYSAMANSLRRIRDRVDKLDLGQLVDRTEDLLESEHAAWVEHMTKTIPSPPPAPAAKADDGRKTSP